MEAIYLVLRAVLGKRCSKADMLTPSSVASTAAGMKVWIGFDRVLAFTVLNTEEKRDSWSRSKGQIIGYATNGDAHVMGTYSHQLS